LLASIGNIEQVSDNKDAEGGMIRTSDLNLGSSSSLVSTARVIEEVTAQAWNQTTNSFANVSVNNKSRDSNSSKGSDKKEEDTSKQGGEADKEDAEFRPNTTTVKDQTVLTSPSTVIFPMNTQVNLMTTKTITGATPGGETSASTHIELNIKHYYEEIPVPFSFLHSLLRTVVILEESVFQRVGWCLFIYFILFFFCVCVCVIFIYFYFIYYIYYCNFIGVYAGIKLFLPLVPIVNLHMKHPSTHIRELAYRILIFLVDYDVGEEEFSASESINKFTVVDVRDPNINPIGTYSETNMKDFSTQSQSQLATQSQIRVNNTQIMSTATISSKPAVFVSSAPLIQNLQNELKSSMPIFWHTILNTILQRLKTTPGFVKVAWKILNMLFSQTKLPREKLYK
jgi:hypothetical protein